MTSSTETELPSDPAIPLLGIYPKRVDTLIQKDPSPVFAAALFTIAETRKDCTCPSRHEWREKMWQTQTHTLSRKEQEIVPFAATRADLEIIVLSEVSQRRVSLSLTCEILKNDAKKFIYKRNSDIENNLMLPKGKG